MTLFRLFFTNQISYCNQVGFQWPKVLPKISFQVQFLQAVNFSTVSKPAEGCEIIPERKTLKVAILGRPNVGKSTFINQILNLNVCDVSKKSHTTQMPLKTAYVCGDTQIIFVDTPGLVTKSEFGRFKLSKSFLTWKKSILQEVDIIGVMVDAFLIVEILRYTGRIIKFKYLNDLPESKPTFLIWNKVDLVENQTQLLKLNSSLVPSNDSRDTTKLRNEKKFSKTFLISALKNYGVKDIVDYLLLQAKSKEWEFRSDQVVDLPLNKLIVNLLRAKVMGILPHQVPYVSSYEVEYLEENERGEIICVALITCKTRTHRKEIMVNKKSYLRKLIEELESDLFKILKKPIRIRVAVVLKEK